MKKTSQILGFLGAAVLSAAAMTGDLQAAVSKLSQIASGGAYTPATDTVVGVRSGTTDQQFTLSAGQFQTPWASNINGGGFSLSNALNIAATAQITGGFILSNGDVLADGISYASGGEIAFGRDIIGGELGLVDANNDILIAGDWGFTAPDGPVYEYGSSGSGGGLMLLRPAAPGIVFQGDIYSGSDFSEVSANFGARSLSNDLGLALTWDGAGIYSPQGATFSGLETVNGIVVGTSLQAGTTLSVGQTITAYNGDITVSGGVAAEVGTADLTAQAAAKTATTLVTPSKSATYRISIALQVTRAASASSILGGTTGVVITYTEPDGSIAQSITPLLISQAGSSIAPGSGNTGNSTTTQSQGIAIIRAKSGTAIQYAIGYTSVGATTMQYAAHLKAEVM